MAVEGGDHRHREGGDPIEEATHAARHLDRVLVRTQGAELLEVASGHERPVSPAAHDDDRRVGLEDLVESAVQLVDGRRSDGVADVGPVDGDDGDAVLHLDSDTAHAGDNNALVS